MDFQGTLFAAEVTQGDGTPRCDGLVRTPLGDGAWIDVARAWLPDADDVFDTLRSVVPWRAERRQMYERMVDVPRLVHTYLAGDELPHRMLDAARDALSEHYLPELGEPSIDERCGDSSGFGSTGGLLRRFPLLLGGPVRCLVWDELGGILVGEVVRPRGAVPVSEAATAVVVPTGWCCVSHLRVDPTARRKHTDQSRRRPPGGGVACRRR